MFAGDARFVFFTRAARTNRMLEYERTDALR
jgi:hypothetical protein